jgi:hypothetical protein
VKTKRTLALLTGLGLSIAGGLVYLDHEQGGGPPTAQLVGTLGPNLQAPTPANSGGPWSVGWVSINGGPGDPAAITVTARTPDRQTLEFKLPGFTLETVAVAGMRCSRIGVPDLVKVMEVGLPELPVASASLIVPEGGRTYLKIVEHTVREIKVDPVEPSVGHLNRDIDPSTVVPEFSDFYDGDAQWPESPAEIGAVFTIREYPGVNVRLNPLRYDAGKGLLLVTEHLVVDVITEGGLEKAVSPTAGVGAAGGGFDRVYGRLFANYAAPAAADKYRRPPSRGRMLIVSHDAFVPHLEGFAAWKRQRGIDVTVAAIGELGGTSAAVGRAIAAMYAEPAGLAWVVLAGDKDQVPTNVGLYDGSDSDSRYAMVAGNDSYPDLFVSRLSASNLTQLLTQVNRIIAYEKTPATGAAAAWYGTGVGIAGDEGSPSDLMRADLLRDHLLDYGFTTVDQIYQGRGGTTTSIRTTLERGCSLVNYLGHGTGFGWTSVPFSSGDVQALENRDMWPWIIDVSCSNGDFDLPTCFAEAWLRAGTPEQPTGAVAMIAATSLTPWLPPTVMQAEVVDLLTGDQANTIGSLCYSGLMQVLNRYAGLDVALRVVEQNVIFGDCSLMVRTTAPSSFDLEQVPTLAAGASSWTVDTGGPEGSVAALTSDGVLHGVGVADAAGRAVVAISTSLDDRSTVTLTMTGYNMTPFITTVTVTRENGDEDSHGPATPPTAPAVVNLLGNFPNPFNPSTSIAFDLPHDMRVRLAVYDMRGGLMRSLVDEVQPAGRREVLWDGRDASGHTAASGVYIYWLRTEEGNLSGRMTLTK